MTPLRVAEHIQYLYSSSVHIFERKVGVSVATGAHILPASSCRDGTNNEK